MDPTSFLKNDTDIVSKEVVWKKIRSIVVLKIFPSSTGMLLLASKEHPTHQLCINAAS